MVSPYSRMTALLLIGLTALLLTLSGCSHFTDVSERGRINSDPAGCKSG